MIEKLESNTGGYVNWESTNCPNQRLLHIHEGYIMNPIDTELLLKAVEISKNIIASIGEFKLPEFKFEVPNLDRIKFPNLDRIVDVKKD